MSPYKAVWKLGEILQTIEQSKIFRDFFDSERFKASQKRTKQARVKTRGSYYTASPDSEPRQVLSGRTGVRMIVLKNSDFRFDHNWRGH